MSKLTGSRKATQFTESVIREMTRLNQLHGGVNLSQGFPDFPAPAVVKDAACAGHSAPTSTSTRSPGALARCARRSPASSREAYGPAVVARRTGHRLLRRDRGDDGHDDGDHRSGRRGRDLRAVLRELRARRDSVGRDAALRHASRARVRRPTGPASPGQAGRSIPTSWRPPSTTGPRRSSSTRPNNPTGKVFTREELETIAALCRKWDAIAISDEIYEHIIYDGWRHVPIATLDGMAERTVTINSLSKTYSVTGWRVGLDDLAAVADRRDPQGARLPDGGRGGAASGGRCRRARRAGLLLHRPGGGLSARRDMLLEILERHHFTCYTPYGAYYIMTDISGLRLSATMSSSRGTW